MKLEDQVCSLELSKKLKELRIPQDSFAYWHETDTGWILTNGKFPTTGSFCSAFTVAELGELLPNGTHTFRISANDGQDVWWAGVIPGVENTFGSYDTEANARAKMLVHLIENKIINPGKGIA